MADKVRILMEDILPDMLQFIKRKVFDKEEVQEIMKTREQHEYHLLRKNTSAIEFLQAIQFEYDLERRRKLKFSELKLKKVQTKDYSIIRRVIQLWDKLTDKFKYNIDLWKQYLSLCYFLKSKKLFFKTITRAVQYNPQRLEFWLMAIYYEYETNNNPFKARKIFYKLLKTNSNDINVWVEYFKFEFKFLEQIYQREQLLCGGEMQIEDGQQVEEDGDDGFRADFIKLDTNEEDEENIKILKQNKITSSQSSIFKQFLLKVIELLKLIYDLGVEKFQNLKFVISLLNSINTSQESQDFDKIKKEVRDIITQDAEQRIKKQENNFKIDAIFEFYMQKYQISAENKKQLDQFFSEILLIEDQNILNGLINFMLEDQNNATSQNFFENQQFLKYFENKSINCLKNKFYNQNIEKILQIYVKFRDTIHFLSQIVPQTVPQTLPQENQPEPPKKRGPGRPKKEVNKLLTDYQEPIIQASIPIIQVSTLQQNFEQQCLQQLKDSQQQFNTNEIILLTQTLSQKQSLEILENQLIENFQKLNKDGIYVYLLRYLEITDLSNQNETIKLINWSIQKLLIYKEEFKKFFQQFLLRINQQSYSQKIYELLFTKLMNLNSLCPLDVYILYIKQQDCKKQNVLKQVDMLFEKIQSYFKKDQTYWELYLAHKFANDPQDCPQILETASKVSGINYSELFAMYNRIQDKSYSDKKQQN